MLNLLFTALLRNSKGSQKAVQQVVGILWKKHTQKSSLLNIVKQKKFDDRVDLVFDKGKRREILKRALRKPSLGEQWKRVTKKSNWKRAFKTESWKYIKRQLWFAKNQGGLLGPILSASKIAEPVADARAVEKSILRKLTLTNKRQVTDMADVLGDMFIT